MSPRPILIAMLGAGIAVMAAGSGVGAAPAQGDPAAKAEVIAAFRRLNALPGYRIKLTSDGSAGRTGTMEVVPPDKLHVTLRSPQGGTEFISVGKESRILYAIPGQPGGWQCLANESRPTVLFDVEKMRKDEVAVVRKPDTVIDGAPVHVYVDASAPGNILYVGTQTGLPRRFADGDKESGGTGDFYDYGAKITITLPPCK